MFQPSTPSSSSSAIAAGLFNRSDSNTTNSDLNNVTTTKALLLSLTVPRVHRVYVPPKQVKLSNVQEEENEEDDENNNDKSSSRHGDKKEEEEDSKNINKTTKKSESLQSQQSAGANDDDDDDDEIVVVEGCKDDDDDDDDGDDDDKSKNSKNQKDVNVERKSSMPPESARSDGTETSAIAAASAIASVASTITSTVATVVSDPSRVFEHDEENPEVMEPEETHEEVGYVQEDSQDLSKDVVVEHVVTAEEMAAVVKLDDDDEEENNNNITNGLNLLEGTSKQSNASMQDKKSSSVSDDSSLIVADKDKNEENNKDATDGSTASSGMDKTFSNLKNMIFAVMNNGEGSADKPDGKNNEPVLLDREQAIQAMQRASQSELPLFDESGAVDASNDDTSGMPPKPNTEIRVEALVRMTFRNLFLEGHFYNLPIYTSIDSRQVDDISNTQTPLTPVQEWVQVDVMVKDPSIGLILERLERIGVGSSVGTISIFKAELCRTAVEQVALIGTKPPSGTASGNAAVTGTDGGSSNNATPNSSRHSRGNKGDGDATATDDMAAAEDPQKKLEAARAEWKNAASRLRVEQVKEQIHEQAKLSLDFLALLTIASILAGIGLIVNSTVVIVASMLVSPIMGPVMGMTFGSRVLDWKLAKTGAIVESIALLGAVLIGAIIGISTSWSPVADEWPTNEMITRGDVTGLLTGVAIAIPSGMGVALSILGNNTASLVGVAISASLLPPAVNAGVCWAHAILIRSGAVVNASGEDFVAIGGISFALTVVNIVCIWVSGMLMFAIKEVAPAKSTSAFWSRDIKVARAIKRGNKNVDMDVIKAGIQNELQTRRKAGNSSVLPSNNNKNKKVSPETHDPRIKPTKRKKSKQDMMEVAQEDNSVQYVGLEDMARYLGFDDDDDDDDDEEKEGTDETENQGFWGMVGWLR